VNSADKKRLLVISGTFPNRYGLWHSYEIAALMDKFTVDILVYKFDEFAGIKYEVDWTFWKTFHDLPRRLMIFDEKYNFLEEFNSRDFSGTKYNGTAPGSYLLSDSDTFDLNEYDAIYCIFLSNYRQLAKDFPQANLKPIIVHLYAGGGFDGNAKQLSGSNFLAISSGPKVSDTARAAGIRVMDVWGCPVMKKNEILAPRTRSTKGKRLRVAYSSMGNSREKGLRKFQRIVLLYKLLFPFDRVSFHAIGLGRYFPFVTRHPPTDFLSLEKFYRIDIDVYLSLTTSKALNGFPMGIEALKGGCPVLSTDPHGQSKNYESHAGVLVLQKTWSFVTQIRKLYKDPSYWEEMSRAGQGFVETHCGFESQQAKISEAILKEIYESA